MTIEAVESRSGIDAGTAVRAYLAYRGSFCC